jgi:hypothetical protein
MHEDRTTGLVGTAARPSKQHWHTPTLSRIEASEAEVATRNQVDGAFTAS